MSATVSLACPAAESHHRSPPRGHPPVGHPRRGPRSGLDLVEELGADGYLYGHSTVEGKRTDIVARVDGRSHPAAGDTVYLTPTAHHLHVFDAETGLRLGGAVAD